MRGRFRGPVSRFRPRGPSIGKDPSTGKQKMRYFPQAGQYEVDGPLTVAVPA